MKNRDYISLGLSLMALVISIVCLCRTYPRELGFDYIGLIVGVLALLTTILIGWQVFILIDLKGLQKQCRDVIKETEATQHKVLAEQEYVNWIILYSMLADCNKSDIKRKFLERAASCLYHNSCLGNWDMCRIIVGAIRECLDTTKECELTKQEIKVILECFERVKGIHKIQGFSEFYRELLLIHNSL
jgi:hypothetical protein